LVVAVLATATLAWRNDAMSLLEFQILIGLIGVGFGPLAPVSTVSLQNAVLPHQFGIAIGAMNFTRSLYTTVLIAGCGALVLAGGAIDPAAVAPGAAAAETARAHAHLVSGFRWIFIASSASMVLAFVALLLMEEKPLETDTGRAEA
jgi:hypothetical protein